MNWASFGFETAATVVESYVALTAVTKMSGQKYTGKRHYLSIGFGVLATTVLISVCNFIETFSFVTPLLVLAVVTLLTRFTSTGSILLRMTGSVLSFLAIITVDYSLIFAMGALSKNTIVNYHTFMQLMSPGCFRYCYLIINKTTDVVLLFALGRTMPKLGSLRKSYLAALLTISSVSYIIMQFLLGVIFADSLYAMQIAIILSWIFMVFCVALAFCVFLVSTNYQSEKEMNQLLSLSNSLMEENYKQLYATRQAVAKRNHDFNHHVKLLHELAAQGKSQEIVDYVESLLAIAQQDAALCHSGNDIVDAIINSKAAEAREKQIDFKYEVPFAVPASVEPVDICAILANQIDNAFDACELIPDGESRKVSVHILQSTESIVLFQVSNRVMKNPLEDNSELKTTKKDDTRPHGLGIKSIKETAAKYNGILENTYQNGQFVSTVMICIDE